MSYDPGEQDLSEQLVAALPWALLIGAICWLNFVPFIAVMWAFMAGWGFAAPKPGGDA